VTVTAHDQAGNTASVSFDVAVLDGTLPVIVGPLGGFTPLSLATDATGKAAIPDFTTQASASDNVAVVGDISQTPAVGTMKTVGPVTVTLSAADAAGNIGTLDLIVNMNDGTLPVITTLPADRTLAADAAGTAIVPDLTGEVVATDNVAVTSITQNPAAGTAIGLGITNVAISAHDAAGNVASGIVHLTVTDQTLPVVHAPEGGFMPVTLTTGPAGTETLPDYAAQATATDNVGVVGGISQTPPAGTAVAVGTTAVTLSAHDAAGNIGALSFNVIVNDGTPPTISGSFSPLMLALGAGGTAELPDYTAQAETSDNVGVVSVTQEPAAGSARSIGITHVTLTAQDTAGNSASVMFDVTVTGDANLVVEQPSGAALASGASIDFGMVQVGGSSAAKTFVIRNTGTVDLSLTSIACVGGESADFHVNTAALANPAPGGSTSFSVTFVPAGAGPRTTTLRIVSNDADASPFDVALGGEAQSLSSDSSLASLAVSSGVLVPAFNPAVFSYAFTVANSVVAIDVAAAAHDAHAHVQVTPAAHAPLSVGVNHLAVQVTAEDGSASIYQIAVTRTVPDTRPPVVRITSPTGSSVPGVVDIAGMAQDGVALASLTVTLNGVQQTLDAPLNLGSTLAQNWKVTGVQPENGSNTIVAVAVDANGNTAKATKTFTFTNTALAGHAGTYCAVLNPAHAPDLDTTGFVTVTVTPAGAFSGKITLSEISVAFSGTLKNDGSARFKPALGTAIDLIDKTDFYGYLGALSLSVSETGGMSGALNTASTGGTALASFAGKVAPYSATNTVPASLLNQPIASATPIKGVYAVGFLHKAQTPSLDPSAYPQGDGYATLTISNRGSVTLAGFLADDSRYVVASKLRVDGTVPLFTQLYRKLGVISGELSFSDLADSDVAGTDFIWLRPGLRRAGYYRDGWPQGIRVDVVGTKYAAPISLSFGQGTIDLVNGNAKAIFEDGLLGSALTKFVSINPANGAVKLLPGSAPAFKLGLAPGSGVLSGSFLHTDGGTSTYRGILLDKGSNDGGIGYFLSKPPLVYGGTGQSGSVKLEKK
jgi:hypothetical protein